MGNTDLPAVVEGGSPQPWRLKKLWEGTKKTPPRTPPRTKSPPKQLVVRGPGHTVPVILRKPKYPDDDNEEDKSKKMKVKKVFQAKHQLPFIDEVKRKDQIAAATKQKDESAFSALKAMVMTRRRLRLDPDKHLHFLFQAGQQVSSVIKITNVTKGHVAFKFQTNAPKSCFMRPTCGVLAPKETLIATVVKQLDASEKLEGDQERKTKDKFKILSLPIAADKVAEATSYCSDLFDYKKENVTEEAIMRVVYLDPNKATPEQIHRLTTRLAEAEVADAARVKPVEESTVIPAAVANELVVDQWRKQREKLKKQKEEARQNGN